MHLLYEPWLLLLLVVAVRLAMPPSSTNEPWSWRTDGALVLGTGLAVGLLCALWMPRYHLSGWSLTSSDFGQYCAAVAWGRGDAGLEVPVQRSAVVARVVGFLAQWFGIVGGLAIAALVSHLVFVSAVFVWARAAHGRFAGVLAATLVAVIPSLTVQSRTASFYPEAAAAFAVAAAGAALALRFPGVLGALAAGVGAGLALLVDVRGFTFGAMAVGLGLLACLRGPLRSSPLRVAAVLLPVAASWWVAHGLSPPYAIGIEEQTYHFVEDAFQQVGAPAFAMEQPPKPGFRWGHSSVAMLPSVVLALREITAPLSELPRPAVNDQGVWTYAVAPWIWGSVLGVLATVVSLRRHPWRVLALVGPAVPFALSLWTASSMPHIRYLTLGLAAAPVLVGVGVAAAVSASGRRASWRPMAAVMVLLVLVLGIVPSWLSPISKARRAIGADVYPKALQVGGGTTDQGCVEVHAADVAAGRTFQWEDREIDSRP
jgi:hypothetical protein